MLAGFLAPARTLAGPPPSPSCTEIQCLTREVEASLQMAYRALLAKNSVIEALQSDLAAARSALAAHRVEQKHQEEHQEKHQEERPLQREREGEPQQQLSPAVGGTDHDRHLLLSELIAENEEVGSNWGWDVWGGGDGPPSPPPCLRDRGWHGGKGGGELRLCWMKSGGGPR